MRIALPMAALAAACLLATDASGQLLGSSNSGMFGSSRSLGGGGGISMGGRSFGGGSGGGIGMGGSTGGGIGSGMGTGGSTGIMTSRDQIMTARAVQSFLGAGNQGRQAPVGVAQASGNFGNRQQSMQGLRAAGGAGGRGQQGRGQGGGRARRTVGDVRTTLNVAFSYPKARPARTGTDLSVRVARTRGVRILSGLRIAVSDGTATLRGAVATAHDRALIERLARLEPGIWAVDNQLVVEPSPPAVPPKPAAAVDTPTPPEPPTPPAGD